MSDSTSTDMDEILDVPYFFTLRPVPVPPDLRVLWRISLLVLLIDKCRGGCATLEQLHVLNWAVRSERTISRAREALTGSRRPDTPVVRFDPSLSRAIAYALGEELVTEDRGNDAATRYRLYLTSPGRALLRTVKETRTSFVAEKKFLEALGGKLSQRQARDLIAWNS